MPDQYATGFSPLRRNGLRCLPSSSFRVAARCGCEPQLTELGQDQIENLQRRHFERALREEVAERIGRAVARDLQDAFVDREQHQARRPRGAVTERDLLARLRERGRLAP